MQSTDPLCNRRGSVWHRWDPHLHAPGTILNDQFLGDWESYLSRIESAAPAVEALGVTDYFSIRGYRKVCEWKAKKRLQNIGLIFPNVEMRLDIKTEKKKPVNIHLLFSPHDPNHIDEIERILGHLEFEFQGRSYKCTESDLVSFGKAFNPTQTDERGALRVGTTQFKATLSNLQSIFRKEAWMRKNCLVAVSAQENDGTSGLQEDDSYAATRREIERFAHIIFSGTPSQREFWLGKKNGSDTSFIEATYGALKPCLHGSDAHTDGKIATPDLARYCWLKGDLNFETLSQAVIEPEERVWIGNGPPAYAMESVCIQEIRPEEMPWLQNSAIVLNSGLVAVIGARGSGKTALVDVIAAGGRAIGSTLDDSSFLKRAINHLQTAQVHLTWADGSTVEAPVAPLWSTRSDEQLKPDVCYLSQHFVERLCSSAGLATELRQEMERVVFEATDPADRMGASSFQELADGLLEAIHRRSKGLKQNIRTETEAIVQEGILRDRLPKLQIHRDELVKQIEKERRELTSLLPKGNEERTRRLAEVEQTYDRVSAKIEALRLRQRRLEELAAEVNHIRTSTEPARFSSMRQRFSELPLTSSDWKSLSMGFIGNVDALLVATKKTTDDAVSLLFDGDPQVPFDKTKVAFSAWPLKYLKIEKEAVTRDVGIESQKQKKYGELLRAVEQKEAAARRLNTEIESANGAQARRQEHSRLRLSNYTQIFSNLIEEQKVLEGLYSPLRSELGDTTGALTKLQFVVQRRIDLDTWVQDGERLLDLRKASAFQGHGALKEIASRTLAPAWEVGSAEQVSLAIDEFAKKFQADLLKARPTGPEDASHHDWLHLLADWLYGTNHIHVHYGIQYEGGAIEQLSPGTRGIVLLLLYLAVDRQDLRPLIVDQPEENLDPYSVFRELVPHFREARKRRQVIVVTHNANLVVNTDADQVIVASSVQAADGGLPNITYNCGSLENPNIRRAVCEILEGGERAFLERARRFHLHWGDPKY